MDTSLLVTLCIIFGVTLVVAVLRGRQRDRCLKDMDGDHVAIQWADGRVMWGKLALFSTGMELSYQKDVVTDRSERKTSYIVYKDEYPQVESVLRFVADLDDEHERRRNRSRDKAFHPGPIAYIGRQARNYVNTAASSLSEALNLALGQSRIASSGYVLASGQTHLKGLTKDVISYVGTSYDPLIESMVGARVVAEVVDDDVLFEYDGVLREYSASFVYLLDVEFAQMVRLETSGTDDQVTLANKLTWCGFEVRCEDKLVIIGNNTEQDAILVGVMIDGCPLKTEGPSEHRLRRGTELRVALPNRPITLGLVVKTVRLVDMILPRSMTRIRHRAERYRAADAMDLRLRLGGLLSDTDDLYMEQTLIAQTLKITEADRRISSAFATRQGLDDSEEGLAIARLVPAEPKENRPSPV